MGAPAILFWGFMGLDALRLSLSKHQINTKIYFRKRIVPEKVSIQATFRGLCLERETGFESEFRLF